ncbi:ORF1 [Anemone nepovirus A]|uniref:ORF1 n=1 Tax=Anemone nepovirus A TaxID=2593930 RepID=A0A7G3W8P0_9SECO|nr:ORF1 [Anemone nepovirus A]QED42865.1 ORF1 [Anemone nepovirus A]
MDLLDLFVEQDPEPPVATWWSSPLPLFGDFRVNRGACALQVMPARPVLPNWQMLPAPRVLHSKVQEQRLAVVPTIPLVLHQEIPKEDLEPSFQYPKWWSTPLPLHSSFSVSTACLQLQVMPVATVLPECEMPLESLFTDSVDIPHIPAWVWSFTSTPVLCVPRRETFYPLCDPWNKWLHEVHCLPSCMTVYELDSIEMPTLDSLFSDPPPLVSHQKVQQQVLDLAVSDFDREVFDSSPHPYIQDDDEDPALFFDSFDSDEDCEAASYEPNYSCSHILRVVEDAIRSIKFDTCGMRKGHVALFQSMLKHFSDDVEVAGFSSRSLFISPRRAVGTVENITTWMPRPTWDQFAAMRWQQKIDLKWSRQPLILPLHNVHRMEWDRAPYRALPCVETDHMLAFFRACDALDSAGFVEEPQIEHPQLAASKTLYSGRIRRPSMARSLAAIPLLSVARQCIQSRMTDPNQGVPSTVVAPPEVAQFSSVLRETEDSRPPGPYFSGLGRQIGSDVGAASTSAPYQQEARRKWWSSRQSNIEKQEDRIRRLADKHGLTFEQARGAFSGAQSAIAAQSPLLPELRKIYSRRSRFNSAPSTRAQRTVDVVLSNPDLDEDGSTACFYFNPVSQQELSEMRAKGNTMLSLDAVEVSIDPVGMPGDDTDLTVIVMWNQNSDPQRALIGAMTTFVGNGLARCVFFPGLTLMHQHCSVPDGRVLKVLVSSTNTTVQHGLPQAQISIGTNRQHLGPGHDRTVSQDMVMAQQMGFRIRATQQGGATTMAPVGGHVEGTPSANVNLGAGDVLIQSGPTQWQLQRSRSERFVVAGNSRPRGADARFNSTVQRPRQEPTPGFNPARHSFSTVQSAWVQGTEAVYAAKVTCAADAKAGTLLHSVDIIAAAKEMAFPKYLEWQRGGMMKGILKVSVYLPTNVFCGHSLMSVFDAFGRYSHDIHGTSFPVKLACLMPSEVFSLADGPLVTWDVDIETYCGHGLFYAGGGYSTPVLHFLVLSDNAVPAAASWQFAYEIFFDGAIVVDNSFVARPFFSVPYSFDRINLGYWKGVNEFALSDTPTNMAFLMTAGAKWHVADGITTYSANIAFLRLAQGACGELVGRIKKVGTGLVTGVLLVALSNKGDPIDTYSMRRRPHVKLLSGEGSFRLPISSAFNALSFLDDVMQLRVCCLAGPHAPKDVTSPFQFMVYFDHIDLKATVPRVICADTVFNWCMMSKFTVDNWSAQFPARLSDIVNKECSVKMHTHPLSVLVASTGFMSGEAEFEFMWSLSAEFGKAHGIVSAHTMYGPVEDQFVLGVVTQPLTSSNMLKVTVALSNYTGCITSGDSGFQEPYIWLNISQAKAIERLNVNVKLKPGLKLYGPTVMRMHKAVGSTSAQNTVGA